MMTLMLMIFRGQLRKKRKENKRVAMLALQNHSAAILQRLFKINSSWVRFMKTVRKIRLQLRRHRCVPAFPFSYWHQFRDDSYLFADLQRSSSGWCGHISPLLE
jgi:hypothetical protein